ANGNFLYAWFAERPGLDQTAYLIEGRVVYDPAAVGAPRLDGSLGFTTRGSLTFRIGAYEFKTTGPLSVGEYADGTFVFGGSPADPGPYGELGRSSYLSFYGIRSGTPGLAGTLPTSLGLADSLVAEIVLTDTYYDLDPNEPHIDVYFQGWGDVQTLTRV